MPSIKKRQSGWMRFQFLNICKHSLHTCDDGHLHIVYVIAHRCCSPPPASVCRFPPYFSRSSAGIIWTDSCDNVNVVSTTCDCWPDCNREMVLEKVEGIASKEIIIWWKRVVIRIDPLRRCMVEMGDVLFVVWRLEIRLAYLRVLNATIITGQKFDGENRM